jgi:hypothetical protein
MDGMNGMHGNHAMNGMNGSNGFAHHGGLPEGDFDEPKGLSVKTFDAFRTSQHSSGAPLTQASQNQAVVPHAHP